MSDTKYVVKCDHTCNKCGKDSQFDGSARFIVCCSCNYAFELYNIEDNDPIKLACQDKK